MISEAESTALPPSQALSAGGASPAESRGLGEAHERIAQAVANHHQLVWRSLRRFGVPERDVADAAQRVFLALTARLSQVAVEKEPAFLVSVAVRVAANARRKLERSPEVLSDDPDEAIGRASSVPSPETLLRQKQQRAELDRWLLALPLEQRAAFVLFELEGFSLPEIASMLEVPVGTATSRLRRARARFEACFGEHAAPSRGKP